MLPLLFGASIGPEAGLTGIIVGLCCRAGDRFKYMGKQLKDLTQIGISATLGVIFMSPLFGFMLPLEEKGEKETVFPKSSKVLTYIAATLGGVGAYYILTNFFGGGMGLPSLSKAEITNTERLWAIPLALAGVVLGFIYFVFHKVSENVFGKMRKKNLVVLSTVTGALILGIVGTYFPDVMFSGESQMETLSETYLTYSPYMLIVIGVLKLLITNVCIKSGWRGGHFFPVIFAGVSAGFGIGMILQISPVFAAVVVTAALMGCIMRKPIAVVLLLMLCFPAKSVVWMLVGACLAAYIPLPGVLKEKEQE